MIKINIERMAENGYNVHFNEILIGTIGLDEETKWFKCFETINDFSGDFLGWFKTIDECEKIFANALIKRYSDAIESKNKPWDL